MASKSLVFCLYFSQSGALAGEQQVSTRLASFRDTRWISENADCDRPTVCIACLLDTATVVSWDFYHRKLIFPVEYTRP